MSDTPIFDETRTATLLDVDVPELGDTPALAKLQGLGAAKAWMYIPPHLTGPCEDRPPHELTDDDGIE